MKYTAEDLVALGAIAQAIFQELDPQTLVVNSEKMGKNVRSIEIGIIKKTSSVGASEMPTFTTERRDLVEVRPVDISPSKRTLMGYHAGTNTLMVRKKPFSPHLWGRPVFDTSPNRGCNFCHERTFEAYCDGCDLFALCADCMNENGLCPNCAADRGEEIGASGGGGSIGS